MLGRAGGGVGSNDLLDFSEPATRPGCADYPIWLERRAAGVSGRLESTGMHSETVKIGANSSRRPMPSFAYTWPNALSTVRTATTNWAAIARLDSPLAASRAISSSRGVRPTGSSSRVRTRVRAPSQPAARGSANRGPTPGRARRAGQRRASALFPDWRAGPPPEGGAAYGR